MHTPPLNGNFRDEAGHTVKSHVVEDYNAHMGFVDKSDRMVNSYGIARRTWKWTILNANIYYTSHVMEK
jgi:hypothetical protein